MHMYQLPLCSSARLECTYAGSVLQAKTSTAWHSQLLAVQQTLPSYVFSGKMLHGRMLRFPSTSLSQYKSLKFCKHCLGSHSHLALLLLHAVAMVAI